MRVYVCVCVRFHPLDIKDGLLFFISPWLQDCRGAARKAVRQQVADVKMSTKKIKINQRSGTHNTCE